MKKFLVIILSLLILPSVFAQDDDPLTVNDLYTWSHILYFPQQIEFELLGKRRESVIETLTLTIDYDNVEPVTIELEPEIGIPTGAGTLYKYMWVIPDDILPPLFSTIRYRWNITTTSGQDVIALDNFPFEDTRITWIRSDDMASRVDIYHAQNQVDPDDIRTGIQDTYDLLFANSDNNQTYKLLIYPDSVPVGCAVNEDNAPIIIIEENSEPEEIECDLNLVNRIFSEGDFILFDQTGVSSIQQSLIELFVELYYIDIWGDTDVPAWFLSGLQRFYDPRPDSGALVIAQQRQRSDDLLTLDQLANEPSDENLRDIWDAQSTGLVLYIADTIGVDNLIDFANNLSDAETFEDAYEDATGTNLDLLLLSWQDWLFRSSTEDDYLYHPYLSDTATPTITPTATNTPTATYTPSLTPDVTSTLRPTFTPIPPTATITPLPAQSFSVQDTETPPTPVTQTTEQPIITNDEDFVTRAAIGGSVILLLLIVLFFVLRQR